MDCLDIRIIQINRIFGRRESCLFDIFATLANYNSLDYLFCFSHEFDFKISYKNIEEGKTIGESIKQNDSNCFDLFFKAYGYKIKYCYIKKIDEEIKFIKESLNLKQPCIVHFDSFYNTVDPLYNKVHNDHCLIVVGITNSGIYTVDPYFNTKSFIPLKLLKKASSFYIYFEKEGEENNRNRIISEILSNKYCTNKEFLQKPSKMYIDLQYLSNLFEHNFDKNIEFSTKRFDQNKIFKNISENILRIGLFYSTIESLYIQNNNSDLFHILENLKCIISLWNG